MYHGADACNPAKIQLIFTIELKLSQSDFSNFALRCRKVLHSIALNLNEIYQKQQWRLCRPIKQTCHYLMNSELMPLSMFYSRNVGVISEGDILLLIVLASTHYPDLLPESRPKDYPAASESHQSSIYSSDSEQYFSPCSSPLRTSSSYERFSVPSTGLRHFIFFIFLLLSPFRYMFFFNYLFFLLTFYPFFNRAC